MSRFPYAFGLALGLALAGSQPAAADCILPFDDRASSPSPLPLPFVYNGVVFDLEDRAAGQISIYGGYDGRISLALNSNPGYEAVMAVTVAAPDAVLGAEVVHMVIADDTPAPVGGAYRVEATLGTGEVLFFNGHTNDPSQPATTWTDLSFHDGHFTRGGFYSLRYLDLGGDGLVIDVLDFFGDCPPPPPDPCAGVDAAALIAFIEALDPTPGGDMAGRTAQSNEGRKKALINRIAEARDLAASGDSAGALAALRDALAKMDGMGQDWVVGAAAAEARSLFECGVSNIEAGTGF